MTSAPAKPILLIVGASARGAAQSAIRAGFQPWCADLFADSDLRAIVPDAVRCPVDRYPNGLAVLIRNAPAAPWIYTGGLENHPRLIRKMMRLRHLWGNGPDALRACRNPLLVQDALRQASLPALRIIAGTDVPSSDCRWLRKPRRGSAGQGIGFADAGTHQPSRLHYYQEFVEGTPMSAVFVRGQRIVSLVGVTEQLIAVEWLNAPPFRYCGNIGPVDVTPEMRDQLLQIGRALGDRCRLKGVYGIDFISRAGRPWVTEVNPRYPASAEVLEQATGVAVLALHRAAFDPNARIVATPAHSPDKFGKAILYAAQRVVMPALGAGWTPQFAAGGPAIAFADIPTAGEVIEPGWPILTLLAAAPTREACMKALRRGAKDLFWQESRSRLPGGT